MKRESKYPETHYKAPTVEASEGVTSHEKRDAAKFVSDRLRELYKFFPHQLRKENILELMVLYSKHVTSPRAAVEASEGVRTKDDILKSMVDVIPFAISDKSLNYIKEAMDIYANQVSTPRAAVSEETRNNLSAYLSGVVGQDVLPTNSMINSILYICQPKEVDAGRLAIVIKRWADVCALSLAVADIGNLQRAIIKEFQSSTEVKEDVDKVDTEYGESSFEAFLENKPEREVDESVGDYVKRLESLVASSMRFRVF